MFLFQIYLIYQNGEREDIGLFKKTKEEAIKYCQEKNKRMCVFYPEYKIEKVGTI